MVVVVVVVVVVLLGVVRTVGGLVLTLGFKGLLLGIACWLITGWLFAIGFVTTRLVI